MDKKNIISTLIEQHRTLQGEVGGVIKIFKNDPIDAQMIMKGLAQFKKDLIEHLKLENEVFYKKLLEEMENKGQDTTKTEQFIAEMKGIETVVVAFLKKYQKADIIDDNLDRFKKEFTEIGEVLTLRIESEEAGVYAYWGLF